MFSGSEGAPLHDGTGGLSRDHAPPPPLHRRPAQLVHVLGCGGEFQGDHGSFRGRQLAGDDRAERDRARRILRTSPSAYPPSATPVSTYPATTNLRFCTTERPPRRASALLLLALMHVRSVHRLRRLGEPQMAGHGRPWCRRKADTLLMLDHLPGNPRRCALSIALSKATLPPVVWLRPTTTRRIIRLSLGISLAQR